MICAVSHVIFDAASTGSNPNANPLCGRRIRVRRGKRSVDVRVVDRCTSFFISFFHPPNYKLLSSCDPGIGVAVGHGVCANDMYGIGVGCKETDLDVSRAVFGDLAELDLGRVVVEWAWLEDVPVSVH